MSHYRMKASWAAVVAALAANCFGNTSPVISPQPITLRSPLLAQPTCRRPGFVRPS